MSPLLAAPNRGYADWQRIENYDSGTLFDAQGVDLGATRTPIIDVSRYAYLGGSLQTLSGSAAGIPLHWYADAAGTVALGARQLIISADIASPAQIRLPNLGPYVQISFNNFSGGSSYAVHLFGTNRVHPLEFIPINTLLLNEQGFPLGSGVSGTFYPTDYMSGPVLWWVDSTGASWSFVLQTFSLAGTWDFLLEVPLASGNQNGMAVIPPAPWRMILQNNGGGATQFWVAIAPSYTGSA